VLEHHLDDVIEDGFETVDIISGINHPLVSFGCYALHTDHMGGDIAGIMEYASARLTHVPVADTVDFRAFSASRYLLNAPGTHARIHQHLDIGQGEVNWDTFFSTLSRIRFEGVKRSCASHGRSELAIWTCSIWPRFAVEWLGRIHRDGKD